MNPVFNIQGKRYVLVTQAIASIPIRELKRAAVSLIGHHDRVTRAFDILLDGFRMPKQHLGNHCMIMMTAIESFHRSLAGATPPEDMELALQALWWAGKGDWTRAHGCAQQQEGNPRCDWVHAYLHRQEGDLENASYWYRSAGRSLPKLTLKEEWESVASELLSSK